MKVKCGKCGAETDVSDALRLKNAKDYCSKCGAEIYAAIVKDAKK